MASSQKAINDARSPIRVVDMGTSQLILNNKSKETFNQQECKTERGTLDELKEFKMHPTRIEKDPVRFKSEPPAMRAAALKALANNAEMTFEREELDNGSGVQQGNAKSRFPKEVFSMSLRKKVCA